MVRPHFERLNIIKAPSSSTFVRLFNHLAHRTTRADFGNLSLSHQGRIVGLGEVGGFLRGLRCLNLPPNPYSFPGGLGNL